MIVEKTPLPKAQSRCIKGCNHDMGKILEQVVAEPITDAVISMILFGANFHEQRHPGHHVEVLIYEKAPELPDNLEIPE